MATTIIIVIEKRNAIRIWQSLGEHNKTHAHTNTSDLFFFYLFLYLWHHDYRYYRERRHRDRRRDHRSRLPRQSWRISVGCTARRRRAVSATPRRRPTRPTRSSLTSAFYAPWIWRSLVAGNIIIVVVIVVDRPVSIRHTN